MKLAIVESGQVIKVGDHGKLFPDTSFTLEGPDEDFLAAHNALKVKDLPSFNADTHKVVPCEPFVEGERVIIYQTALLTVEELVERAEFKAAHYRQQRNQLLADSDWTQLPGSPVDAGIWADYRQELRDVPEQEGFPWSVTWPTKPQ